MVAPSSTSSTNPRRARAPASSSPPSGSRADVVNIRSAGSSVDKGESLRDTVQTLSAYDPAAIVIRSPHARGCPARRRLDAGLGDQCGRRQARASDPGAARRVHVAAPARLARRREHLDRRRRAALARRALGHPRLPADGRERHGLRAADAAATRDRGARLHGDADARAARRGRRRLCPAHAARAHGGGVRPVAPRVRPALPDRPVALARGTATDAPGPGQPRRRAVRRRDRLARRADRRAGQGGRRHPDGGSLRAPRRSSQHWRRWPDGRHAPVPARR